MRDARTIRRWIAAALILAAQTTAAQHRRHHRRHRHHRDPPAAAEATAATATATVTVTATTPPAVAAPAPEAPPPVVATAPEAPPPVPTNAPPPDATPWRRSYVTRPLLLPAGVPRVDGFVGLDRTVVQLNGLRLSSSSIGVWLRVGAGYGVARAVEVGASVTPLRIEAGADFQDAYAYGRFRFWGTERMDLGAQLDLGVGNRAAYGFAMRAAVLLRWRFEGVRLDVNPGVDLFVGGGTVADLRVPVEIWWQVSAPVAIALRTGVIVPNFDDSRPGITAGVRAIYAIGRDDRPFVDLVASLDFEPAIHLSGQLFRDDFLVAQLGAQVYLGR